MINLESYPEGIIFIVDNNYSNIKLLSTLLINNNYEVVTAKTQAEVLKTLENISIDLILINQALETEPWKICHCLKNSEVVKNIPIILMKASQNAISQEHKLNIENVDKITMPIQVDDVLTKIKFHIQLHSLKKKLQSTNQILEEERALRNQVETELQEHKNTLSKLIENLPGMVYHSNHDCKLTMNFVSNNCYSLTGYQPEELIQNRITYNQLIHPEYRKKIACQRQKAIVKHQPFDLIYQIITAKKELKWFWEQGQGIFSSDGNLLEIKGLIIDITAQKQTEAELTKQNLALQKTEAALIMANQQLEKISRIDGLTGIANRRHFDEYLDKEWRRLTRTKSPLTLILCDVDYFKQYNDNYGHLAGDDCLREIAKTINKTLKRSADLVARYGGEEFAIILPNTPSENAEKLAELIRRAIYQLQIDHSTSKVSKYITISMGIASVIPAQTELPESLIAKADDALYQAKQQGRDRIVFFDRDINVFCCCHQNTVVSISII
ncbi:MAG: diguanylate cyclase [Microcoleaceae cyanobacterium MO_207.B10]|nr:diguanylate cyclase [Microcoleaceae cyanobacterium MO_207.B10]